MSSDAEKNIASVVTSTLVTGLLGAGLVYFGRRNKGLLAAIGETVGYSLLTKAVSSTILAALEPAGD